MRITVMTPTYNRAYIIKNLYDSLKLQTFRDFEWIIIDDGSTDNTSDLVESFISESIITIHYRKVSNGGKHRAVNLGAKLANGDLFFIVDSDDYLTSNALELIDYYENTIPTELKNKFCGICGLKGYNDSFAVGSTFKGETLDATILERASFGIQGDKSEVFYTETIRRYPFPEFENEKFLTECIVWDRMAHDELKLRFFNKIIYICDYLPDGLSANSAKLFSTSPQGYALLICQSVNYGKISGVRKWNKYLEFYYSQRGKNSFCNISKYLKQSPVKLYLGLLGIRLFYKLYDR